MFWYRKKAVVAIERVTYILRVRREFARRRIYLSESAGLLALANLENEYYHR